MLRHLDLDAAEDRGAVDHQFGLVEDGLGQVDLDSAEDRDRLHPTTGPEAPLALRATEDRDHLRVFRAGRRLSPGRSARGRGLGHRDPLRLTVQFTVGREVPGERHQLAQGLRGIDGVHPLRVLLGRQPALGIGLAQGLRDPLAVGVGRAQAQRVHGGVGRLRVRLARRALRGDGLLQGVRLDRVRQGGVVHNVRIVTRGHGRTPPLSTLNCKPGTVPADDHAPEPVRQPHLLKDSR